MFEDYTLKITSISPGVNVLTHLHQCQDGSYDTNDDFKSISLNKNISSEAHFAKKKSFHVKLNCHWNSILV